MDTVEVDVVESDIEAVNKALVEGGFEAVVEAAIEAVIGTVVEAAVEVALEAVVKAVVELVIESVIKMVVEADIESVVEAVPEAVGRPSASNSSRSVSQNPTPSSEQMKMSHMTTKICQNVTFMSYDALQIVLGKHKEPL